MANTFGALYIGLLVSTALWGVTSVQYYVYLRKFPRDVGSLQFLVLFVWILDTLGQGFISQAIWYYFIDNFNNTPALNFSTWSLDAILITNSIMACTVQLYFGVRMFQITRGNWLLTGGIILSALATFGLGVALTIRASELRLFLFASEVTNIVGAHVACAVLCDVLISGGLTWYLHRAKSGFRKSDGAIHKLIVMTVNRGVITCIFVIIELVCFLEMPDNLVYLGLHFVAGKLYAISWLGALNARRSLQGRDQDREKQKDSFFTNVNKSPNFESPPKLPAKSYKPSAAPRKPSQAARRPLPPTIAPVVHIVNTTRQLSMDHPFGPRSRDDQDTASPHDLNDLRWSAR